MLSDGPLVDRVVGVQGTFQVAGQKVRVGRVHARMVVHVHIEETALTVYDGQAVIAAAPLQSTTDVNRFRAKHPGTDSLASPSTDPTNRWS